jgi:hypothetical protein
MLYVSIHIRDGAPNLVIMATTSQKTLLQNLVA